MTQTLVHAELLRKAKIGVFALSLCASIGLAVYGALCIEVYRHLRCDTLVEEVEVFNLVEVNEYFDVFTYADVRYSQGGKTYSSSHVRVTNASAEDIAASSVFCILKEHPEALQRLERSAPDGSSYSSLSDSLFGYVNSAEQENLFSVFWVLCNIVGLCVLMAHGAWAWHYRRFSKGRLECKDYDHLPADEFLTAHALKESIDAGASHFEWYACATSVLPGFFTCASLVCLLVFGLGLHHQRPCVAMADAQVTSISPELHNFKTHEMSITAHLEVAALEGSTILADFDTACNEDLRVAGKTTSLRACLRRPFIFGSFGSNMLIAHAANGAKDWWESLEGKRMLSPGARIISWNWWTIMAGLPATMFIAHSVPWLLASLLSVCAAHRTVQPD